MNEPTSLFETTGSMELAPGDIVEIEGDRGLAYVQVTHRHPSYPEIVRSLPGLHASRPDDLAALARNPTGVTLIVPLGAALAQRRIAGARIGNVPVPPPDRIFPTFKIPIGDRQGGVAYWWLWDGDGLRYSTEADETFAGLPTREVLSIERFLAAIG